LPLRPALQFRLGGGAVREPPSNQEEQAIQEPFMNEAYTAMKTMIYGRAGGLSKRNSFL
jgi:hypothetical protein